MVVVVAVVVVVVVVVILRLITLVKKCACFAPVYIGVLKSMHDIRHCWAAPVSGEKFLVDVALIHWVCSLRFV